MRPEPRKVTCPDEYGADAAWAERSERGAELSNTFHPNNNTATPGSKHHPPGPSERRGDGSPHEVTPPGTDGPYRKGTTDRRRCSDDDRTGTAEQPTCSPEGTSVAVPGNGPGMSQASATDLGKTHAAAPRHQPRANRVKTIRLDDRDSDPPYSEAKQPPPAKENAPLVEWSPSPTTAGRNHETLEKRDNVGRPGPAELFPLPEANEYFLRDEDDDLLNGTAIAALTKPG